MYSMIWHKLCKCQVECQFKLNEKTVYLCVFCGTSRAGHSCVVDAWFEGFAIQLL